MQTIYSTNLAIISDLKIFECEPQHDFFGESHDVTKCDISSTSYDLLMHKPIRGPALCVMR